MKLDHQPYPKQGQLAKSLNLGLGTLRSRLCDVGFQEAIVYCYVIATIKSDGPEFLQTGNAPNFQGDLITLCTCKHFMRTFMDVQEWKGKWIAGFTGIEAGGGQNALVYMMRVAEVFESHRDLWQSGALTSVAKESKAVDKNKLGDIYRPRPGLGSPFDPNSYEPPIKGHGHEKDSVWHGDICYSKGKAGRRPALLLGETGLSFLWGEPMVHYPSALDRLHRGQKRLTLGQLLVHLES